jgi:hypothetical protein
LDIGLVIVSGSGQSGTLQSRLAGEANRCTEECHEISKLNCFHLYGYQWYDRVEETDHVQESAGDILSHNDSHVIILGVPLALNAPILEGSDYVTLIRTS